MKAFGPHMIFPNDSDKPEPRGCPAVTCDWDGPEEHCPTHGIAAWYRDRYDMNPSYDFGD